MGPAGLTCKIHGSQVPFRPQDEGMKGSRRRWRSIEPVPALVIGALEKAGSLPLLPPALRREPVRQATLDEITALTWLVAWEGPALDDVGQFGKAAGVAAFVDRYDPHTSGDVREIVHIAGSRRAVVDLIRWMHQGALEQRLRLIGAFDASNQAMTRLVEAMGFVFARVVWEDSKA
jgi:hypothetical protein